MTQLWVGGHVVMEMLPWAESNRVKPNQHKWRVKQGELNPAELSYEEITKTKLVWPEVNQTELDQTSS